MCSHMHFVAVFARACCLARRNHVVCTEKDSVSTFTNMCSDYRQTIIVQEGLDADYVSDDGNSSDVPSGEEGESGDE